MHTQLHAKYVTDCLLTLYILTHLYFILSLENDVMETSKRCVKLCSLISPFFVPVSLKCLSFSLHNNIQAGFSDSLLVSVSICVREHEIGPIISFSLVKCGVLHLSVIMVHLLEKKSVRH